MMCTNITLNFLLVLWLNFKTE